MRLAFLAALLLGCDPTVTTPPADAGLPDVVLADPCPEQPNYTPCATPVVVSGVCVLGQCVKGCAEDAECDDGDPCTDDVCVWGHCENEPACT